MWIAYILAIIFLARDANLRLTGKKASGAPVILYEKIREFASCGFWEPLYEFARTFFKNN
jgi:hypothetical protein